MKSFYGVTIMIIGGPHFNFYIYRTLIETITEFLNSSTASVLICVEVPYKAIQFFRIAVETVLLVYQEEELPHSND